jgi:hypothetical protein
MHVLSLKYPIRPPQKINERNWHFIPEKNDACTMSLWKDIKINILETGCVSVNWTEQAQDSVQWQAFVKALTNIWVP